MTCTMKELVSGIKRRAEKFGVLCDSKGVVEGARSTNQNGCFTSSELAHLGLPWAPTTRKGRNTDRKWRKWKPSKHKSPILTTAETTLLSISLPVEEGFLFPLHYSTLGQVSSKLLRTCSISSLPLCLALWVLLSALTSFLAAQTQQSPSSYCFPKVHILYHLQKLEVLT